MDDPTLSNKQAVYAGLADLAASTPGAIGKHLAVLYAPDAQWRGSHPMNEMQGLAAMEAQVWAPLLRSFPDLERRDEIVVGGRYEGRDYVACIGHYLGTFRHDWLTIPATGKPIYIRYGEVHQIVDGKIVQSNCLWDVLDVIQQAGFWPLPPALGTEGRWPGPITQDGIVLTAQDAGMGAANLTQTLAMHGNLHAFGDFPDATREDLLTMPQKEHWHPRMMWYGPAGIGTTRGLQGFVDYHQRPFRMALPRPQTDAARAQLAQARAEMGGGHYIRIGDGKYSVTGGWPSRVDIHSGPNWLGLPPTGKTVGMRVMDFYLHDEGRIRENWVPIDIIDVMKQLGVDVFARLLTQFKRGAL
jgi:predicted ester cyclase